MRILVINGVNLNLLGTREPEKYGTGTLKDLEKSLYAYSFELGIDLEMFQSNFEGEIVEKIHSCLKNFDGIVINAGAYTHTSVAIRDALAGVAIPTVEVHLTNIYKREEFRHHSYIAPVAIGQISGLGFDGYKFALSALKNYKSSTPPPACPAHAGQPVAALSNTPLTRLVNESCSDNIEEKK